MRMIVLANMLIVLAMLLLISSIKKENVTVIHEHMNKDICACTTKRVEIRR